MGGQPLRSGCSLAVTVGSSVNYAGAGVIEITGALQGKAYLRREMVESSQGHGVWDGNCLGTLRGVNGGASSPVPSTPCPCSGSQGAPPGHLFGGVSLELEAVPQAGDCPHAWAASPGTSAEASSDPRGLGHGAVCPGGPQATWPWPRAGHGAVLGGGLAG